MGLKPIRVRVPLGPLYGGVLDAVHGPEIGDPYSAPPRERPYVDELVGEVKPLRIGVWPGIPGGGLSYRPVRLPR